MDPKSPFLAIIPSEEGKDFYNQIAVSLGCPFANIIVGSPANAAAELESSVFCPKFILIDIGSRSHDILPEIDHLAEQCEMGVSVVVSGDTNDISFYRALIGRGVSEYLPNPVDPKAVVDIFKNKKQGQSEAGKGKVISFMSAASGDGASSLAVNTAYAVAEHGRNVVVVDMDYQFGMVAKNLDLASQYGIRDIFEHPERGIDATLLERMVVRYDNKFDVIAAPVSLNFMPEISPNLVREFIDNLQQKYDYVIVDLPHSWSQWTASIITASAHIMLIGQLWLKSVTHASRLLGAWRRLGVEDSNVSVVINRSGAKFKEAVNAKDFERVTGHRIGFYISNDIKTVVEAENKGVSLFELGSSSLANQIDFMADEVLHKMGDKSKKVKPVVKESKGGKKSLFKFKS